jgi:hypothetical protein
MRWKTPAPFGFAQGLRRAGGGRGLRVDELAPRGFGVASVLILSVPAGLFAVLIVVQRSLMLENLFERSADSSGFEKEPAP